NLPLLIIQTVKEKAPVASNRGLFLPTRMTSVSDGTASATGHTATLDHVLNLHRRTLGNRGYSDIRDETEDHDQGTDPSWRDTEPPVSSGIQLRTDEFEEHDITEDKDQPHRHTGNRTFLVHPLGEDAHHNDREEGRRRQTEGKSHHLRHEGWWVNPEQAGDDHRDPRRNARCQ